MLFRQFRRQCFLSERLFHASSGSAKEEKPGETAVRAKPFSEIPHPPFLPLVGSMFYKARQFKRDEQSELLMLKTKEFGQFFFDKIANFQAIMLACPKDVADMYAKEGRYPRRVQMPLWREFRLKRDIPLSVGLGNDEEWLRYRRACDKPLLVPANIYNYLPGFNDASCDTERMMLAQQRSSPQNEVEDLRSLLLKWSLESVCLFLYDQRIGCLSENPSKIATEFYGNVGTIFRTSAMLMLLSPKTARIFARKLYKEPDRSKTKTKKYMNRFFAQSMEFLHLHTPFKHEKAWEAVYRIGAHYAIPKIQEVKRKMENNEPIEGFLASMVQSPQNLTEAELISVTIDLMGGGVDATATTVTWFLHCLAQFPEKQECLFQELQSGLGGPGKPVTAEFLKHAPYLKACLRESQRLRPATPGTGRIMPQDTIVNGYHIPKGTLLVAMDSVMTQMEEYFDDPQSFIPERWLDHRNDADNPESSHRGYASEEVDARRIARFASTPFGFGPRSCVGRRLAEQTMYVLIAHLVNNYHILNRNDGLVDGFTRLFYMPKVPLKVRLEKRV